MSANREILFVKRPDPDVSLDNFAIQDTAAIDPSSLDTGSVLMKLVYVSVDPYMRARMNETKSYFPGWDMNKPPTGGVVAEVVESKNDQWQKGDLAQAFLSWKLYQVVPEAAAKGMNKIPAELKGNASYFVGACGMPGLSALLPIKHIGQPKAGEVAFVSGAAGAVGSIAGQILKINGLKVFGSAGTDEKVKFLKDIGFDGAFNYNTTDLNKELAIAAPEGIDIYFDNVGGNTLEITLNHMKKFGRVIMCGSISNYNKGGWEEMYGIRTLFNATTKSLRIQGFIVSDWASEFKEATPQLVRWVLEGKLKVQETVLEGLDSVPKAFVGLFTGANLGKMVIKI